MDLLVEYGKTITDLIYGRTITDLILLIMRIYLRKCVRISTGIHIYLLIFYARLVAIDYFRIKY